MLRSRVIQTKLIWAESQDQLTERINAFVGNRVADVEVWCWENDPGNYTARVNLIEYHDPEEAAPWERVPRRARRLMRSACQ